MMGAVSLEAVYKIYRQGPVETVALRGASLAIEKGECIAVTGRSGSGKSTMLSILGGLALPSAGKARVAEVDLAGLPERDRARFRLEKVGIVYQDGNLVPWLSAIENVSLPLRLAGRRDATRMAKDLLYEVGLESRGSHRPYALSGGERQRVAVAVALANDPELVLADEPTGELDATSSETVMDLLLSLNKSHATTLVIVTHNAAVAKRAGRVVQMEDGLVTIAANGGTGE